MCLSAKAFVIFRVRSSDQRTFSVVQSFAMRRKKHVLCPGGNILTHHLASRGPSALPHAPRGEREYLLPQQKQQRRATLVLYHHWGMNLSGRRKMDQLVGGMLQIRSKEEDRTESLTECCCCCCYNFEIKHRPGETRRRRNLSRLPQRVEVAEGDRWSSPAVRMVVVVTLCELRLSQKYKETFGCCVDESDRWN